MNKLIVLLLISFGTFAQTQKGMFTAGSRVFNYTNNANFKQFSFSPSAGFLVGKNTEFGVSLNIDNYKANNINQSTFELSNYIIQYFGRNKAQPYLFAKVKYFDRIALTAGAGVQYFIVPNVAVSVAGSVGGKFENIFQLSGGFSFYIPQKK